MPVSSLQKIEGFGGNYFCGKIAAILPLPSTKYLFIIHIFLFYLFCLREKY